VLLFITIQVLKLQQQLEEKDREVRAAVLTAKQATKKAEEATAAAKKQAAATNKAVQEAVAATLAQHKAEVDKQVHLMLCVIKDPAPASSKQPQVSSCWAPAPAAAAGWGATLLCISS
jgi:hypothetical protein